MKNSPSPRPIDFLLSIPLYNKRAYAGVDTWQIIDILYFRDTYDSYCPKCKRDSTFRAVGDERPQHYIRNPRREAITGEPQLPSYLEYKLGAQSLKAICTRQEEHRQDFIFFIDREIIPDAQGKPVLHYTIEKIGQQPSYGDLHLAKIKNYKHVLTKDQMRELSRAISLASHDVGVGSYVYLRRVFESLVEEAHQQAILDDSWNEEAFQKSYMDGKIKLLKEHLPRFLVEHPLMYSLLSKGIHELSEQECLEHFETLRIGIELILDQKHELKRKALKEKEADAALQKALGSVSA
jgi:hypothetical protein